MRIHNAIFGEQSNGHALLASSGDSAFAAKLTVLTDRPGDPPAGADWGPVVSGFALDDHYVFMRMLPDPTGRRAGMVRTYAAYVPLAKLGELNNLLFLFSVLPSGLGQPPTLIEPLDVSDSDLAAKPDTKKVNGCFALARLLCAPDAKLPLLWSSTKSYLPAVAMLWAQLPPGLRTNFSFQFLFAPEHYTPAVLTLAITLPDLAGRWPTASIVNPEEVAPVTSTPAQSWLAGSTDGAQFEGVLRNYAIELPQFAHLNLVSSFVDMVDRLSELSFVEARKAVNIAAKFSRITNLSRPYRTELFGRLCALTKAGTADDLLTLRNLKDSLLPDLIPDLKRAMQDSIAARSAEGPLSGNDFEVLKEAAEEPSHWWSEPFVDWLQKAVRKMDADGVRVLVELASSAAVLELVAQRLPTTNHVETNILEHLPKRLAPAPAENLATLAARRGWMRLHAGCLARSLSPADAVARHAATAGLSDIGLPVIESILGFKALAQAACKTGAPALIAYAGLSIGRDPATYLPFLPTTCQHGRRVLQAALSAVTGRLTGDLRIKVIATLEETDPVDASFADLSIAAASCDPSLLLDIADPSAFVARLPESARQQIDQAIEEWLCAELQAGHILELDNPDAVRNWLGSRSVVDWLAKMPVVKAVQAGVNAFRCLPFLNDADCRRWLVTLFTQTQYQHLDAVAVSALADFLGSVDFPESAQVVRETTVDFHRPDVAPVHERIRYKYQMARAYPHKSTAQSSRLKRVLIVTALPLERSAVIAHLPSTTYDYNLQADVAVWPALNPFYEIYVVAGGAGNLAVQGAVHRFLKTDVKPCMGFFVGVCGAVKDSDIGDVVFSTKVYYTEGGKEEDDGVKARPAMKETANTLVQLGIRVAETAWQPADHIGMPCPPKATPAVLAASEQVLASIEPTAESYQRIKRSYNDTQAVDMEAYGFLKSMQDDEIMLSMVVRGVSDKIAKKSESDAQGNQPLAARNAAAFLFALLHGCPPLLQPKKGKRKGSVTLSSRRMKRGKQQLG